MQGTPPSRVAYRPSRIDAFIKIVNNDIRRSIKTEMESRGWKDLYDAYIEERDRREHPEHRNIHTLMNTSRQERGYDGIIRDMDVIIKDVKLEVKWDPSLGTVRANPVSHYTLLLHHKRQEVQTIIQKGVQTIINNYLETGLNTEKREKVIEISEAHLETIQSEINQLLYTKEYVHFKLSKLRLAQTRFIAKHYH